MVDFWTSESIINKIQMLSIITCVAISALGAVMISVDFSLGVLVGGIIVICNFYGFQKALKKIFNQGAAFGKRIAYSFKYLLRITLAGIVLYLVIQHQIVHPLGLITGLSVIVLNIMALAFIELRNIMRTKEAV